MVIFNQIDQLRVQEYNIYSSTLFYTNVFDFYITLGRSGIPKGSSQRRQFDRQKLWILLILLTHIQPPTPPGGQYFCVCSNNICVCNTKKICINSEYVLYVVSRHLLFELNLFNQVFQTDFLQYPHTYYH